MSNIISNLQEETYVSNPPNASYGESLTKLGYTAVSAVADLVDNCPDADATNIAIEINKCSGMTLKDPIHEIVIFDNGYGMNMDTAIEAMKYGSNTGKSRDQHMGIFGSGMKSAGTSIGRRLTVFSRTENGELIIVGMDLDVNEEVNDWITVKYPKHVTQEQIDRFEAFTEGGSGTAVFIDKIQEPEYKTAKGLVDALKGKRALRLIFRKFLASNQYTLRVNSAVLKPWGYDYVDGFTEVMPAINFKIDDLDLGTIKIVSTLGTDHKASHTREQGIVVLRNHRDISGTRIDWHKMRRHTWELAGVYVIWDVNASNFDSVMKTTLMKNDWVLPQRVLDRLSTLVNPDLNVYIKLREQVRQDAKLNKLDDHLEKNTKKFENSLNNNAKITAPLKIENPEFVPVAERNTSTNKKDDSVKGEDPTSDTPKKTTKSRKPFEYTHGGDTWNIKFEHVGDARHFQFAAERRGRGREFTLTLSLDHPWITKNFCSNMNESEQAMFALLETVIGDAHAEATSADPIQADGQVRAKSEFLRTRSLVTTSFDSNPIKEIESVAA